MHALQTASAPVLILDGMRLAGTYENYPGGSLPRALFLPETINLPVGSIWHIGTTSDEFLSNLKHLSTSAKQFSLTCHVFFRMMSTFSCCFKSKVLMPSAEPVTFLRYIASLVSYLLVCCPFSRLPSIETNPTEQFYYRLSRLLPIGLLPILSTLID